ncbi:MAG TPA: WYL domain-containing protein [Actinomycetota bacterium]|nr:WYL domain-containing protein [Actinomycetota bacterium]
MRRIERLINLIAALLEARQPMTAEEIRHTVAGYGQESFEAFRRAFERDKDALRSMGIPLEIVPRDVFSEQADAYTIPKDRYYLPDLDLEPDEIAALGIAAEAVVGAGEEAGAGLMKLSLDDPVTPWDGPRVVWGADVAAEQPHLGPLYTALTARRPVRFEYRAAGEDSPSAREVEPYGIVHRRGNWYLVGRDRARDDVRSFRVSRITGEVALQEGGYEVPRGFRAAERVPAEPWEAGPERAVIARIRFEPSLAWWPRQNLRGAAVTEMNDGSAEAEMPVSNTDALVSWVIGFAGGASIVEPAQLRMRVREHISGFTDAADGSGG